MRSHRLLSLLVTLSLFSACDRKGAQLNNAAETISAVSSIVSAKGEITVRFVEDQATREQTFEPIKKRVVTLEPSVDGVATWSDTRTLRFTPEGGLKSGQQYVVTVDLNALLPTKKLGLYTFKVAVPEVELLSMQGDFVTPGNDPTRVDFRATLTFSKEFTQSALAKAVQFVEADGKEQTIAWDVQGATANLLVANLVRGKNARRFQLKLDGAALGIPQSQDETFDLPPVQDFVVNSVTWTMDGSKPQINIAMSDPVADRFDLAGFVTVSPAVKFSVTAIGDTISLSGDFSAGKSYKVTVKPGIRSRWATTTQTSRTETVDISDQLPTVQFSQSGVYLPGVAKQRLGFKSVNVKKVLVRIAQVYENNLGQFLQEATLLGKKDEQSDLGVLTRVGTTLHEQTLTLDTPFNTWAQSEIDLGPILTKYKRGLFIVELRFKREDIPFTCTTKLAEESTYNDEEDEGGPVPTRNDPEPMGMRDWRGPDEAWRNPCHRAFYYSHGTVTKPVIFTDIGLTAMVGAEETVVVATDLNTAAVLGEVNVRTITFQNQPIESGSTDANGIARLKNKGQTPFLVMGEWQGQKTVLRLADGPLEMTSFDTGGATSMSAGVRAYTYTERGVFRPGDTIHLTAILRHPNNTFPKDMPVELRLVDPRGQQVRTLVQKSADDGFYVFTIDTQESDFTGTWQAGIYVGSTQVALMPLKIETIVPQRLKVKVDFSKARLEEGDKSVSVNVASNYLFGAPASGLEAKATLSLVHRKKSFPKFSEYVFDSPTEWKTAVTEPSLTLNREGRGTFEWKKPDTSRAPAALSLIAEVRVYEKGGRFATTTKALEVEPWKYYVGIRSPDGRVRVDEPTKLEFVLVDANGVPVTGRPLKVRIFSNNRYWWWEHENTVDAEARFKSDRNTVLFFQKTVTSENEPVSATFTAKEFGQLLVEVQDGDTGHKATALVWTEGSPRDDNNKSASLLSLRLDKKRYNPGDTATVQFASPPRGRALVSVDRAGQVLSLRWVDVTSKQTSVQIPITEAMTPNSYVVVSFIQPRASAVNDKPMRLYGAINVPVEVANSRLKLALTVKEELAPQAPFTVKIRSTDSRPAQVTVAVVDEGILDVTNFVTPNPWAAFFAKLPLGVALSDVFDRVIGPVWGDIFQRFSIGGSDAQMRAAMMMKQQQTPIKAQRFKPVSLFKGPLVVPPNGELDVPFDMPNYNGSVRVMVAAAHQNAYASLEATRPVRKPLIVLPTLPRVVGPKDTFELPVTVFGLKPDIGTVDVTVSLEGPLELVGPATQKLTFNAVGEQDTTFKVRAKAAAGVAKVTIRAKSARYDAQEETEIAVRPSSPSVSDHEDKVLEPNVPWTVTVAAKGISGTQQAKLVISNVPSMSFTHRYDWLIQYPYGCTEQIASSAFVQLNVAKIFPNLLRVEQVDRNINAAVSRLASLQRSDGSFRYWPQYERWHDSDDWLTSYVGDFLVSAQKKGYYVPPEVLEKWLSFQRQRANTSSSGSAQAYRLYTLALAGKPDLGAMNVMRENKLASSSTLARLLLANAYQLAGSADTAKKLLADTGEVVTDAPGYARTFGSDLRDDAIALQVYTSVGDKERAFKAYERIARKLSSWDYYDTQALSWAILAAGDYVSTVGLDRIEMKVRIEGAKADPIDISSNAFGTTVDVTPYIGKRLTITSSSSKPVYAALVDSYVPLEPPKEKVSERLNLSQEFYDDDGAQIQASDLPQGKSFWLVLRVSSPDRRPMNNVALTQVLPAGWEIENTRLSGESLPKWLQKSSWALGTEQYVDIRDDRISWFFTLAGREERGSGQAFAVKLNAVTQGEYLLPPTIAEAMYDADIRARLAPRMVKVVAASKAAEAR